MITPATNCTASLVIHAYTIASIWITQMMFADFNTTVGMEPCRGERYGRREAAESGGMEITIMIHVCGVYKRVTITPTLNAFSIQTCESESESVPNAWELPDAWNNPSLALLIAPQACPQKSKGHKETRFDHPEFNHICHEESFQIRSVLSSPFARERRL